MDSRNVANPTALRLAPEKTMHRRQFLALVPAAGAFAACRRGADEPIGPHLAPATLASRLEEVKSGKVAVFYVGPGALFARGHVPGARNVGEADSSEGLAAIRNLLTSTPADTEVVFYCGCCPVRSCPNVRPVSAAIRASGRKNAWVLDLPTRFSTDWADKGFAVERS